jgi:hypothetical protein
LLNWFLNMVSGEDWNSFFCICVSNCYWWVVSDLSFFRVPKNWTVTHRLQNSNKVLLKVIAINSEGGAETLQESGGLWPDGSRVLIFVQWAICKLWEQMTGKIWMVLAGGSRVIDKFDW